MGNYNPKTANQFRWQDSIKIQKFIQGYLVVNDIDFKYTQNYITEDIPDAKKLVDMIRYCYENQVPLIIYDYSHDRVWNSTYFADEQNATLISYDSDRLYMVDLSYNGVDTLEVNYVQEELLIADNVKTLFGEQSIIGQGNIDLYRHTLGIIKAKAEYADTEYRMLITYYSSKNLKVDSLQDLTTLTKASSTNKVILTGIAFYNTETGQEANTIYSGYCGVQFDGSNWKFRRATDRSTPTGEAITSVSDIVTTI